jgi:SnoaL-like domain
MGPAGSEIVDLGRRYLAALVARDTAMLADTSVDGQGISYLGIGSPPDENWDLPHLMDHLKDFPPTSFTGSAPTGFRAGDVAWLWDFPVCELPSGERIAIRASVVLVRVEGEWKVAHWHLSEGVPHEL